jgi:hypothetical protein
VTLTAAERISVGLAAMRAAYYYKQTRIKNPGIYWPKTLLAQAEQRFMARTPTRELVQEGLTLFRRSWAYQKTLSENPTKFGATKIGQAETEFKGAVALLPQTVFDLGIFAEPGVFCINPSGGVEEPYAEFGFKWAAANIGDYESTQWDGWIARMRQFGVTPIYWRRVRQPADSEHLCQATLAHGLVACVHNLEWEAVGSLPPATLALIIDRYLQIRHAVQTEPWVQNGAGWQELGRRGVVGMPESYLNVDPRWDPNVVVSHAEDEGLRVNAPTFGWGIWSDAQYDVQPSEYLSRWPNKTNWNVYPVDGRPRDELDKWRR